MEQAIVLGRLGHYFDAGNGSCSTALVVDTTGDGSVVNIAGWHHDAGLFNRAAVLVEATPAKAEGQNSFHLNASCPWSR